MFYFVFFEFTANIILAYVLYCGMRCLYLWVSIFMHDMFALRCVILHRNRTYKRQCHCRLRTCDVYCTLFVSISCCFTSAEVAVVSSHTMRCLPPRGVIANRHQFMLMRICRLRYMVHGPLLAAFTD